MMSPLAATAVGGQLLAIGLVVVVIGLLIYWLVFHEMR